MTETENPSGNFPPKLEGAFVVMCRICDHQVTHMLHPLTCGNDSSHAPLFPVYREARVMLRCVDCDYTQEVPEMFLCGTEQKRAGPVDTLNGLPPR